MKVLTKLLIAMIVMVVGCYLISPVFSATEEISTAEGVSSGVSSLATFLPLLMIVVIILAVFKGFQGMDEKKKAEIVKFVKNAKSLVITIERASKNLSQYINNLDEILGIKTIIDNKYGSEYGLSLSDGNLYICGGDDIWDWYITDKHPTMDIFKVVGLHKKDVTKNLLYVLGRNSEQDNAYLIKVPEGYIEQADIKECLQYAGVAK
jgi:uncharacterized membrane protein